MAVLESLVLHLASFLIPALIYVVIALGLNLQFGKAGVFNAGVAAFIAVGGYTFGLLTTGYVAPGPTYPGHAGPSAPMDLIPAALISMVVAGIAGVLIAAPTLRLRADYLAIATLALGEIIRLAFKEELHLTGGDQTLPGIPRPFGGVIPSTEGWASDGVFVVIILALTLVTLFVLEYITRIPWDRALRAVREDEEAAMALGKDAFRLKLSAFGIGCMIMGLAGVLIAMFEKVISPERFTTFITFNAYVIVILGGSGNNRGVFLGGFVFWLFTWGTINLKTYLPSDWVLRIDFVNLIVIGIILILFILFRPEGIIPEKKYIPPKGG
jgi:branched-chain amino acid transport system permease protein